MGSIKKFVKFFLIWYSQQMAIPFWVIGHVHLHFVNYHDFYEYSISAFCHLMVAVGFWIDWKQNMRSLKNWNWDAIIVWSFIITVSFFFWRWIFNLVF